MEIDISRRKERQKFINTKGRPLLFIENSATLCSSLNLLSYTFSIFKNNQFPRIAPISTPGYETLRKSLIHRKIRLKCYAAPY